MMNEQHKFQNNELGFKEIMLLIKYWLLFFYKKKNILLLFFLGIFNCLAKFFIFR